MKTKILLPAGIGLLMAMVLTFELMNDWGDSPTKRNAASASPMRPETQESIVKMDPGAWNLLQAALAESDPARRQELLGQWAETISTGKMGEMLSQVEATVASEQRAEVRQILLASWIRRDMPDLAGWFGNRYAADALHQDARDVLVKNLAAQAPGEGMAWMKKSLSDQTRLELYGPIFRQWAKSDPTAAAMELRQLTETSRGAGILNDLIAQFAAQWATTNLEGALAWTKSLPDGAAKTQALVQVSYLWAKRDPQAAALAATQQKNGAVFDAVASTWAGTDPGRAAAWAFGLPAGAGHNSAVSAAVAVWAQTDPKTAAAYVAGLPTEEARGQGKLVIASVWAYQAPAEAAKWVEQFPEGTVRELALEQVVSNWAGNNSGQAGQWLEHLPEARSRDVAVGAYCQAIGASSPDVSFQWAETIGDESIREQKLASVATSWLKTNPAAARQSIAQSSLPEAIKKQLMAQ